MSKVEEPDYKILSSKDNIEIREYLPMTVAEVEVSGERREAIREGFKILADYIFGNNTSNKKIEMIKPVISDRSEKIAMTAPVMQEQDKGKWKVRFVMPKKYTLETLPKPNSKEVVLLPLLVRRVVVIRFSGVADDESIKQHTGELQAYMLAERLKPIGEPLLAFYNPPWTLSFLRRNEVMIQTKADR